MAVNFNRVARIHKVRQFTVYGFIREQEDIYDLELMAIEGIVLICLLFYANDFIDDLLDVVFGKDDEWISQQKQIKDYFMDKNIEFLRRIKKIHCVRKLEELAAYYARGPSGRLITKLRNSSSTNIADMIIADISKYRNARKELIKSECMKANINANSWSTPIEANQFLSKVIKLKPFDRHKIIVTFCYMNDMIIDIFDLAYGSDKAWIKQQRIVKDYFSDQNNDITRMNKVEFTRKIASIIYYPTVLSGYLHQSLLGRATKENDYFEILPQSELITMEISRYRRLRKQEVLKAFIESNVVGIHDWSTRKEAEEFLLNKLKLSQHKIGDVISKLFDGSSII